MNAKKARAQRKRAHLSDDKNSAWTPMRPAQVKDHPLYDPALDGECFQNSIYTVFRREIAPGAVHLSIRRNDRRACKDWRDFQRIKNELAGPEWEGMEIYPAESRLVDASNQYHLWCVAQRLAIGFDGRCVTDEYSISGAKQRELPPDWEPTSVQDIEAMTAQVKADRHVAAAAGIDFRGGNR